MLNKDVVILEELLDNSIEGIFQLPLAVFPNKQGDFIYESIFYNINQFKYQDKYLELVLTKKWYDMIECGEKKIEYRDITQYWWKRIFTSQFPIQPPTFGAFNAKHKYVRFRHGYSYEKFMIFKIKGIDVGKSKPEWSFGLDDDYIRIHLHNKINLVDKK